jgi:hypothetical protein
VALLGLGYSANLLVEKRRATDLADAASLSVASWYAQAMNYQAYANRAIAANEIMIAQSITALSWMRHAQKLSENSGQLVGLIPGLAAANQWFQQSVRIAEGVVESAARAEIPARSAYTRALLASQEAMRLALSPFATQSLVNEIVWSGDRRFFGQYLPTADVSRYYQATRTYSGAEAQPMAQFLTSELDSFSRQRQFDQRLYLYPTHSCIPTSWDRLFGRMIRGGGTALTPDYREWEAVDTLSAHSWRRRSWWNPTCSGLRESIALGWGSAQAGAPPNSGVANLGGASRNPSAFARARNSSSRVLGYLGLSPYRDLSDRSMEGRQRSQFRVPILVRLAEKDLLQSSKAAGAFSALGLNRLAAGHVWASATAHAHFVPGPGEPQDSLPSLFLPYWRANLVGSSALDQAAAILVMERGDK